LDNINKLGYIHNQKMLVESIISQCKHLCGVMDCLSVATIKMDRVNEIMYHRKMIEENKNIFEQINLEMMGAIEEIKVKNELPQSTP